MSPPQKQHNILILNSPMTLPSLPIPHTLTHLRPATEATLLAPLQHATILITAVIDLSYTLLSTQAPNLELIICMGTGVDNISSQACRERGITLLNTPAQNIASVTEHAFALLGAVKRKVVVLDRVTREGEAWARQKMMTGVWKGPPRLNCDEVLGIVGFGALGQTVEKMAKALGMRTLIAERKSSSSARQGRVPFVQVLRECTILMLTAPLTPETKDMIAGPELATLSSDAIIVNVGRGEVVNETALASALKEGRLGGAATDVYQHEPATRENCPLLDEGVPNLVLSPHVAWYSDATLEGIKRTVVESLKAYLEGRAINVIVAGKGVAERESS